MAANIRLTDKVSNVNEEDELRKRGYIVGVTLGEGSYAKVKSAYYEKTDKKVALKIINRKKAPKDFQTRFLPRELDILRRIKHPNIVQLLEDFETNNELYLVMELVKGGDLFDAIARCVKYSERDASGMLFNLASALKYLHNINIVHRDIKPENLMVKYF